MVVQDHRAVVRLEAKEEPKKGFFQQLYEAMFVVKETSNAQAEITAPIPMKFGEAKMPTFNKYEQYHTWRGKPMTRTQFRYQAAPHWWVSSDPDVPNVLDGAAVFDRFTIEEWNDMSEDERMDAIAEWKKVNDLTSLGIPMPEPIEPDDPQARAAKRMHERAVANNLAREMEAHKRKLERELAEAEEREKLYEGNAIYGAF